MITNMFRSNSEYEIFNAIILFILISMMNYLIFFKVSTEKGFHDKPMFFNIFSTNSIGMFRFKEKNISVYNCSAIFVRITFCAFYSIACFLFRFFRTLSSYLAFIATFPRTIFPKTFFDSRKFNLKRFTTNFADSINHEYLQITKAHRSRVLYGKKSMTFFLSTKCAWYDIKKLLSVSICSIAYILQNHKGGCFA